MKNQEPRQKDEHRVCQPAREQKRRDPDEKDDQAQERATGKHDGQGRQEKRNEIVHAVYLGSKWAFVQIMTCENSQQ